MRRLVIVALLSSRAFADDPMPPEEDPAPDEPVAPEDFVSLNAGFWLNYTYNLFDATDRDKQGDFGPGNSMFRVGFDVKYKGIIGAFRMRWYSYARVWEFGWMGYRWKNGAQLEVGMTKVPFGVLPFASYDYWFDIPYYLGFNNQYDVGVKWSGDVLPKRLNVQAGFFKNSDIAAADDTNRFSYDVVRVAGMPAAQNEETNQLNARVALLAGPVEAGASIQYGGLYNYETRDHGRQAAGALHVSAQWKNIDVQLQAMQYMFEPRNSSGIAGDTVYVGAFADAFPIAARGRTLAANIGYDIHVDHFIDTIKCYDNFSILLKARSGFEDSRMNTVGCSVMAGPFFGFVDLISAKNAPYIGTPADVAFTTGGGAWHSMFNVNLGFYFKTAPLALSH